MHLPFLLFALVMVTTYDTVPTNRDTRCNAAVQAWQQRLTPDTRLVVLQQTSGTCCVAEQVRV